MRSGLLITRGEWAELGDWVERTRIHSTALNVGYWRTVSSLWSAWMQGRGGEPELATARMQEHLDAYVGSGGGLALPQFHMLIADLRLFAGDAGGAIEELRAGLAQIEATGERFHEPELLWYMGKALMAEDTPDPDGATAAFEHALEAARAQNAKLRELRAASLLAAHQHQIGAESTALATVRELCEWFGTDVETPDLSRARALARGEAVR
jgi:predicted ATPase